MGLFPLLSFYGLSLVQLEDGLCSKRGRFFAIVCTCIGILKIARCSAQQPAHRGLIILVSLCQTLDVIILDTGMNRCDSCHTAATVILSLA